MSLRTSSGSWSSRGSSPGNYLQRGMVLPRLRGPSLHRGQPWGKEGISLTPLVRQKQVLEAGFGLDLPGSQGGCLGT